MNYTVIRYQTKPDAAVANAELSEAVFAELRENAPDGVRYLCLRTGDGAFFHVFGYDEAGETAITGLPAFSKFRENIDDRLEGEVVRAEVSVVGDYEFLTTRERVA